MFVQNILNTTLKKIMDRLDKMIVFKVLVNVIYWLAIFLRCSECCVGTAHFLRVLLDSPKFKHTTSQRNLLVLKEVAGAIKTLATN
jgi:hypothetical protein